MEPLWYYARDGKQAGPISEKEMRDLVARGDLRGTDLIWKKGTPDWVEVRSVPGMIQDLEPIPEEIPRSRNRDRDRERDRGDDRPARRNDRYRDESEDDYRDRNRGRGRDRDRAGYDENRWDDRREYGPPVDVFGSLQRHLGRMFTWNLQKIEPTEDEKTTLAAHGITDETTQKYSVWRRSVLWVTMGPTYLFALLAAISHFSDFGALSVFGILAFLLLIVANFALPTGALLAAMSYARIGRSNFWLMAGTIISFLVPILVALIPGSWLIKDARGTIVVIGLCVSLIPAVLSILPGVSRGCLRVKSILPASVVAGWGYVLSVPLQILFSLAIFIGLYQLTAVGYSASMLLLMGVLCWFASPAIYLFRIKMLTTPMTRDDLRGLGNLSMAAMISTGVGIFLVMTFMFVATESSGRVTIMGFGRDSIISPFNLDLHKSWIEYLCRSLLMAVLLADLLIRMNLAIWRQDRAMSNTELGEDYNKAMENLATLVTKGDPLQDGFNRRPVDPSLHTLDIEPDDVPILDPVPAPKPRSTPAPQSSIPLVQSPPEMTPEDPPPEAPPPRRPF